MTCRIADRMLSAYIDAELSGHEMFELRAHLSDCASCQRELERLKCMKALLNAAELVEPSRELHLKLKRAVSAPILTRKQRQRAFSIVAMTACVSALLVALVIAQSDSATTPKIVKSLVPVKESHRSMPIADGSNVVPLYPAKY